MRRTQCSECEAQPASRSIHAIVAGERVLMRLSPPEAVCLTCYRQKLEAAGGQGLRLETSAILVPIEAAQVEAESQTASVLAAVGF